MTQHEIYTCLKRGRNGLNDALAVHYIEEDGGLVELFTIEEYEVIVRVRDRMCGKIDEIVNDNHVLLI